MSEYIHEEKKVGNEYQHKFALKNPQIFGRMNIFVNKYLNIFEYPIIPKTLVSYHRSKPV